VQQGKMIFLNVHIFTPGGYVQAINRNLLLDAGLGTDRLTPARSPGWLLLTRLRQGNILLRVTDIFELSL
jgi:hypothetical protein